MPWDDDKKQRAINLYKEANPTPETTTEILAEIAEELGESPNGVRMILTKAEVYVKKDPTKPSATASKTTKSTCTRVSKEAAHKQLVDALEAAGKDIDEEIISKLTGKAALYFAGLFA